ncbi:hypothetical protein COOONC_03753 [Cooperia oncophora]
MSVQSALCHVCEYRLQDVYYTGVVAGALSIPKTDWSSRIYYLLEPGTTEPILCDEYGSPLTVAYFPLQSPEEMQEGFHKLVYSKCPPQTVPDSD